MSINYIYDPKIRMKVINRSLYIAVRSLSFIKSIQIIIA
jgi:hypothetical protein